MKRLDFFLIPFSMDTAVAMSQVMVNLRALDLGASATEVGLLMGLCWGVAYMLTALTTGKLVGRYGAKRMMLIGAGAFAGGTAAYGMAGLPWHLLAAAPVAGAGSGIFWPSLQTYLRTPDAADTRIRTGLFNVSWTLGILTGVGVSGRVYGLAGSRLAFLLAAGIVCAAWLYVLLLVTPVPANALELGEDAAAEVSRGVGRAFLRMAWVANFVMWLVGSSATTVFPRLARGLRFSDGAIGEITAVVWLGQVVFFALLASGAWWHYRKSVLLLGMAAGMAAVALYAYTTTTVGLVLASAMLGASRTPSHVSSLHYGLHTGGNRDANMGYHEAVLGAGCVAGPILSGLVADAGGVRAAFVMCMAILIIGGAVIGAWPVRHGEAT